MKTLASIEAFVKPENIVRRITHKEICFYALKNNGNLTIRQVSKVSGLTYNQAQKRISELLEEKKIVIVGEKEENGNNNSVFKVNNQPKLFDTPKPLTFSQYARKFRPEWIKEYESHKN